MTKVVGIDAAGQRVELKFVQLETPNIWVSTESDDICEQYTHCKKPVRCLMAEPLGTLRFLITRDRCVFNGSSVQSCPAGRLTMWTALPLSCPQAATAVLALPATSVTTSTSGYTALLAKETGAGAPVSPLAAAPKPLDGDVLKKVRPPNLLFLCVLGGRRAGGRGGDYYR